MTTKNSQKEKAILIANYFIKKNLKERKELDNKKIQKLLYYAQAWNLVFNGKRIFPNKIEAWVHGPAIPEVYRHFKYFDFTNITENILKDDFGTIPSEEKNILNLVWKIYGKYDGNYLEVLTHNELPWQEARKGLTATESSKNIISEERMKEYYEQKLKEAKTRHHSKDKKSALPSQ